MASESSASTVLVLAPGWTNWHEAIQVVTRPAHLRKTVTIALLIGSTFAALNQLPIFLAGHADAVVVAKTFMTYLTPFFVSNYSILVATRRKHLRSQATPEPRPR